jgi:hypothetical protein
VNVLALKPVLRIVTANVVVKPVLRRKKMNPDVFDYKSKDFIDDLLVQYYDCELRQPIGPYKADEVVPVISIDYEEGYIEIFDDEEDETPAWKGKINFTFEESE